MKRITKSFRLFKALLVAGLLAVPLLASKAQAQGQEDNSWLPQDVYTDNNGNQYAYWSDPNNWGLGVPVYLDTNDNDYQRVIINGNAGNYIACVITNDVQMEQLIMGDSGSGGGTLIITNGAQVQAGIGTGEWTGIGFPNGPSTLYIGTNCSFTIGSHLWVGQGTNNGNPAVGTVIVDGGALYIPYGQLGVGWNGDGGTNYITFTNGGKLFLDTWAGSTLGYPGNANGLGIMNLADAACSVTVTNNQTGYFNTLVTNNQLIAYGGLGKIAWIYNPVANITTISAIPPFEPGLTPVFSGEPTNTIVSAGGSATLSVTMSNNMACNFQWLFNNAPLTDGNGISGSKTATLTIANVSLANVGIYYVQATNASNPSFYAASTVAALSTEAVNLYPVVSLGGVSGSTYEVDYTASLAPPVTWIPLATNTVGAGISYFVDTNSPLSIKRFYRVVQH